MDLESLNLQASDVRFLPIVSAFVKKIGEYDQWCLDHGIPPPDEDDEEPLCHLTGWC
ncbi:MAG: hypothetical protein WCJ75_13485 [Desulfomonile sp.]